MVEESNSKPEEISFKEQRIKQLTNLYYSKPEVQEVIFNFAKNREVCPVYFKGFGKRPDTLEYKGDIIELVKKGATSFHCSEELWKNPLEIETGMSEKAASELRLGWDFLLDIDSKYIDYSKIMAKEILKVLEFHGVKNVGIKFSGSRGFHMIIPWKAFPKEVNEVPTSQMFPEWPRIILNYLSEKAQPGLIREITKLSTKNEYVRDDAASKEVIPDLVLVSPRHLFRMPYSLHEKTALASIVLSKDEIDKFELKDASPLKVKIKNFIPNSREAEAIELLREALDWNNQKNIGKQEKKVFNQEQIKIKDFSEKNLPPCVKDILNGMDKDGKKRALFVLINIFRSSGMEKDELEEKIYEWDKKNKPMLGETYIKPQLSWNFRRKPLLPPNCKEFYQGIGVCTPDEFCKTIKNPLNYLIRKATNSNKRSSSNKTKFKNNL
ncbi:MAG: DNA primase small subunit domain-containing protein [archaeon]